MLLARTLWREGYDDHLAGHITYRQADGTLLCNPWLLLWEELRPDDLLVIDLDGNRLEGHWPVPLGIPLHLELHRQRQDVEVAVHSHPRYGTVWADLGRVPGCYDQSSALGGGELVVVDEYDGPVDSRDSAAKAVSAMGSADMALLANHGVFVTAGSIRAAHQRAVALEYRSRRAWHVESLGDGRELPDPAAQLLPVVGRRGLPRVLRGHGPTGAPVRPPLPRAPGGARSPVRRRRRTWTGRARSTVGR